MSTADPPAATYVERRKRGFRLRHGDRAIAIILFVGLICLILTPFTFFAVGPGEVGVLYRLFQGGTVTTFVYNEGIGVKWPWNTLYRYEVRTQARDESVHGLATDGLSVGIDVTVLYHPIPDKAGFLHKEVGPNYAERLVRPVSIEAVRDVVGKYGPHELYQMDVVVLEQEILKQLKLAPAGFITYEGVIVRNITLPPTLNAAITRKLTEQQNAQAYEYLIIQAEREAERKRIEAIGIQTFYSIVANALTPQLLTWRGIEATVQIARSNNAKVVIVGGGKDQLPLILGSDIANQPNLPAPSQVDPAANPLPNFDDLPRMFPDLPATSSQEDGRAPRSASSGPRSGLEPNASAGETGARSTTDRPATGTQ